MRMPTYKCPTCDGKLVIGLEVAVGGTPKHECPKCKVAMVEEK